MVNVVMANYNAAAYLADAIRSVQRQRVHPNDCHLGNVTNPGYPALR